MCCRDAIENAGHLYNQVDELVHRLVMLSNKCTQELEFIMEFKILEEGFTEVRTEALYLLFKILYVIGDNNNVLSVLDG